MLVKIARRDATRVLATEAYHRGLFTCMLAPVVISKTNPVDIILLCGSPGAGKSTFYWRNLQPLGYERVNQDILKTVQCLQFALIITDGK